MTKQELNELIRQVEKTSDIDEAEELYEQILNELLIWQHFSGHIFSYAANFS